MLAFILLVLKVLASLALSLAWFTYKYFVQKQKISNLKDDYHAIREVVMDFHGGSKTAAKYGLEKRVRLRLSMAEVNHILISQNVFTYTRYLRSGYTKLHFDHEMKRYRLKRPKVDLWVSIVWNFVFAFSTYLLVYFGSDFYKYLHVDLAISDSSLQEIAIIVIPFWLYLLVLSYINVSNFGSARAIDRIDRSDKFENGGLAKKVPAEKNPV